MPAAPDHHHHAALAVLAVVLVVACTASLLLLYAEQAQQEEAAILLAVAGSSARGARAVAGSLRLPPSKRRRLTREPGHSQLHHILHTWPDDKFRERLRMNKTTFNALAAALDTHLADN